MLSAVASLIRTVDPYLVADGPSGVIGDLSRPQRPLDGGRLADWRQEEGVYGTEFSSSPIACVGLPGQDSVSNDIGLGAARLPDGGVQVGTVEFINDVECSGETCEAGAGQREGTNIGNQRERF